MKNVLLLIVSTLISAVSAYGQAPQSFKYQAVVRDNYGLVLPNQSVSFEISIIADSTGAQIIYQETHDDTTNMFGLVNLNIGTGNVNFGNFGTIDWGETSHFIQVGLDETGGNTYDIMGTSQLLSVPYALHANTADSLTAGIQETDPIFGSSLASSITTSDTTSWGDHTIDTDTQIDSVGIAGLGFVAGPHIDSTAIANMGFIPQSGGGHFVGEIFGGGIVFLVYDNGNHGLVASLHDLDGGNGVLWGDGGTNVPNCESMTDGLSNTTAVMNANLAPGYAASLCDTFSAGGFTDWYLPSLRELDALAAQDVLIDLILDNDNNPQTTGFVQENTPPTYGRYWSSTEQDMALAWFYYFPQTQAYRANKNSSFHRVRAIRAF